MKYQNPMIKGINEENEIEDFGAKVFKRGALIFCLLSSMYLGQGVLKSLGEIENQQMARESGVPFVEQSYVNYMCLGAKNLAGKVYSILK